MYVIKSTRNVMYSCIYSLEQVNSLREIQALRRLNPHPNIVELKEVVLYVIIPRVHS